MQMNLCIYLSIKQYSMWHTGCKLWWKKLQFSTVSFLIALSTVHSGPCKLSLSLFLLSRPVSLSGFDMLVIFTSRSFSFLNPMLAMRNWCWWMHCEQVVEKAKGLGSHVADSTCGRAVLFILFNLWKLRLAFLWSTKNWKHDLIQIVLCLKGK